MVGHGVSGWSLMQCDLFCQVPQLKKLIRQGSSWVSFLRFSGTIRFVTFVCVAPRARTMGINSVCIILNS